MTSFLDYILHAVTGSLFASSILGLSPIISNKITSSNISIASPIEYRINTTPQYSLINPLIYIDTDQKLYSEYNSFDKQINSYINAAHKNNQVDAVSVYLRDMNSGHWTGINENDLYEPGSMLKVAVLIAYERYAMDQATFNKTTAQDILSQNLYYPGADEAGQYYKSINPPLQPGMYDIQTLLNHMIIDSDNSALLVLIKNQQNYFNSVYNDFRLPPSPTGEDDDFMTAQSYSVIFRSLYNGTYLNRSASNQALQLLTQTTFKDGLIAGLPDSTIPVAHKFGERTYELASGIVESHELHDCGIIYYPSHPYLLCVMTKGNSDYPTLAHVIADISKMTYQFVSSEFATTTASQ